MATVLITGANRGIGLALSRYYCQHGCDVIAVCRQSSPALAALNVKQVIEDIDITDQQALSALQQALAEIPIDILINNAGILAKNLNLGELDYVEYCSNSMSMR
jgi:NAD(P)-dependent dehydrogenase (short-subunit alcohol dehydrogenase family)